MGLESVLPGGSRLDMVAINLIEWFITTK